MANTSNGMRIIDVTCPVAPVLVGRYDSCGETMSLDVAGGLVYAADDENGLAVLRVDLRGDANCDWRLTLGDINPFVLALADPDEYRRQYPECNLMNADCNDDGRLTFGDISPFVELLAGG